MTGYFFHYLTLFGEGLIASIIIDGYNVIGISHKDLKRQRGVFIQMLTEYRKRKNHEITVVFDGWKTGQLQESRSKVGGVTIIYSRIGEKADIVIKRIISTKRHGWIVVTTDRDIANYVWARDAVPISGEDFMRIVEEPIPSYADMKEYEGEEYQKPRKKGSSRKPSKKEKAIRRALSKL